MIVTGILVGLPLVGLLFVFLPILISPAVLHRLLGATMFDLWNWIDLLLQTCGILLLRPIGQGLPVGFRDGTHGFKEPVGNSWFRKIFPTPFPCQHPRDSTALSKVAPSIIVFFGIMTDSLRVFSTTNNHNNNWLVVWNIFFIFHNIWDNPSRWLIFFTGVETTNQIFYNHLLFGGHRNAGRLNPHQICFDAARDFYEGIVDNIGIMWDNSGDDDDDDDDRKDMGLSKNGVILVPGYPQYGHLLVGKRDLQPWDFGYFGGIRGYPIFSQTQLLECRFLPRSSCFFNTWSMKKIPWTLVDWPI